MDREPEPGLLPLSDAAALPTFDVALRGYDRRQVDEYLDRIEQDLAVAQTERDTAVERVTVMEPRLESLENEVRAARAQLVESARPTYAGLGARVEQLLRLAEEQATQLRADAERDTDEIRQNAERMVAEAQQRAAAVVGELEAALASRRQAADQEAATQQEDIEQRLRAAQTRVEEADALIARRAAEAVAEAERRMSEVKEQIDRLRQDGEQHAMTLVEAARADTERHLADAQSEADRLLDAARQEAEKRRADSDREIAEVRARRETIERQLASLRDVLGDLPPREPDEPASDPRPAADRRTADAPTRPTAMPHPGSDGR